MHFRWNVVQQHCAPLRPCPPSPAPAPSSSDAAMSGDDGEQDHVGCAGWIAEKQMRQSGYGAVLRACMSVDVRSSFFGAVFLNFSDGLLLFVLAALVEAWEPPGISVSEDPNVRAARRPGLRGGWLTCVSDEGMGGVELSVFGSVV